jgi:hypothetical protein
MKRVDSENDKLLQFTPEDQADAYRQSLAFDAVRLANGPDAPTVKELFPNARTVGRLEAGAWDGLLHEVKTALKQGEDVSQLGKVYGSALHAAAVNGHLEIVKLLIACGADANARDRDGMTAVETRRK